MKLLAIVGSPRANGNTYKTVLQIVERIQQKDPDAECEIIQLSKTPLQPCIGCFACCAKGEHRCPLKDERETIDKKMQQADGVIFATPVYTYNVSAVMKNFLDRFAYRCHRPEFHGHKAMVVATTGAVGLAFVERLLAFMLGTMGFVTCAMVGRTVPPAHEQDAEREQKERRTLENQTDRFVQKLADSRPIKPSFAKLITFNMQRKAFTKAPKDSADFAYWSNKGWLGKQESYYYPVTCALWKKVLAKVVSRLIPA